eukprot:g2067.t1
MRRGFAGEDVREYLRRLAQRKREERRQAERAKTKHQRKMEKRERGFRLQFAGANEVDDEDRRSMRTHVRRKKWKPSSVKSAEKRRSAATLASASPLLIRRQDGRRVCLERQSLAIEDEESEEENDEMSDTLETAKLTLRRCDVVAENEDDATGTDLSVIEASTRDLHLSEKSPKTSSMKDPAPVDDDYDDDSFESDEEEDVDVEEAEGAETIRDSIAWLESLPIPPSSPIARFVRHSVSPKRRNTKCGAVPFGMRETVRSSQRFRNLLSQAGAMRDNEMPPPPG